MKNKKNKKEYLLQKLTDMLEDFFLNILKIIGLTKIVNWYKKHQEGMRYLIFGGISTIINIIVFVLLEYIGLSTLVSNTLAWIISVIFAYFTNKICVFHVSLNSKKELIREISSFLGCRVFTLIIDEIYMYITIDIFNLNSILMKIISNIIVIVLNFIFSKLFIFKKKNN